MNGIKRFELKYAFTCTSRLGLGLILSTSWNNVLVNGRKYLCSQRINIKEWKPKYTYQVVAMELYIYSFIRKYLRSFIKRISPKEGGRLWCVIHAMRFTSICALIGLVGFSPWIVLASFIGINQIGNVAQNVFLFVVWLLYAGIIMILATIIGYIRESNKIWSKH